MARFSSNKTSDNGLNVATIMLIKSTNAVAEVDKPGFGNEKLDVQMELIDLIGLCGIIDTAREYLATKEGNSSPDASMVREMIVHLTEKFGNSLHKQFPNEVNPVLNEIALKATGKTMAQLKEEDAVKGK